MKTNKKILTILLTLGIFLPSFSHAEPAPEPISTDIPPTSPDSLNTNTSYDELENWEDEEDTAQTKTLLPLAAKDTFGLPDILDFNHPDTAAFASNPDIDAGTLGIINLSLWIYDIARYIIGAAALLLGAIAATKFVTARGSEEKINQAKRWFEWGVFGMIVFSLAWPLKDAFLTSGDSFFLGSGMNQSIAILSSIFLAALRFITYLLGAIAVIFLIASGSKLVVFPGNSEVAEQAKKTFTWSLLGLTLFMLSSEIVGTFYGYLDPDTGQAVVSPDSETGRQSIVGLSNFLLYFFGPFALLAIIIAAVLYTTAGANEENKEKAKKIIIATIMAIVLAYSAYTIISEIILAANV